MLAFSLNTAMAEDRGEHGDTNYSLLAAGICGSYATSGHKFVEDFNFYVEKSMKKIEGIANPTVKQKVAFLNKNKDKMTCGREANKKNYMMQAFEHSGAPRALFRKVFQRTYMKEDRSARVDVNAVSYTGPGGAPQTVIDYMDGVFADKSNHPDFLKEVKSIRRFCVNKLGAKTFAEFDEATQAKYHR